MTFEPADPRGYEYHPSKHQTKGRDTGKRKVRTRLRTLTDIPGPNASINLHILLPPKPVPQLFHFFQTLWHKLLPALARVDGHDEDHIGRGVRFGSDGGGGRLWGDGEACEHVVGVD